jgi:hypothetical protein
MARPAVVALLGKARALIDDPRAWCRGTLARNGAGYSVSPIAENAVAWCAIGAIEHFDDYHARTRDAANSWLDRAASLLDGTEDSWHYNDASGRKHAEIMQLYDQAIALATTKKEQV